MSDLEIRKGLRALKASGAISLCNEELLCLSMLIKTACKDRFPHDMCNCGHSILEHRKRRPIITANSFMGTENHSHPCLHGARANHWNTRAVSLPTCDCKEFRSAIYG